MHNVQYNVQCLMRNAQCSMSGEESEIIVYCAL